MLSPSSQEPGKWAKWLSVRTFQGCLLWNNVVSIPDVSLPRLVGFFHITILWTNPITSNIKICDSLHKVNVLMIMYPVLLARVKLKQLEMPSEKKIIYFSSLSITENRISLAGSVFNSFLVLIKASSLQGRNWHSGRLRKAQSSFSVYTGPQKGGSTHLSVSAILFPCAIEASWQRLWYVWK